MQTYKIWYEPDPDIPEFKMLAYELVDVDIKYVLLHGIHPITNRHTYRTLVEGFTHQLNVKQFMISEITDLKYCEPVQNYSHSNYYREYSHFEELIDRINKSIRFVDNLTIQQMINLAKEQLSLKWNHQTAKQMVHQLHYQFNDIRSFIKAKDSSVKLASYDDLDRYDLSEILSIEDFESEDQLIIQHGLPVQNFRKSSFLPSVTDSDGLLKLTDTIDHFDMLPEGSKFGQFKMLYRCVMKGNQVKLIPGMNDDDAIRLQALEISQKWRIDEGNYCFMTSIDNLREMIKESFQISFPQLDYINKKDPYQPNAMINRDHINSYVVGAYPTLRCSGEIIKQVLRQFGKTMTGNKEQLLVKLAKLAVEEYRKHEQELSVYFTTSQFIKADTGHNSKAKQFPLLSDYQLRNIVITMYLLKHLRGNVIVDASYDNDTFDLYSLAHSLVKEDISLKSQFLHVQN